MSFSIHENKFCINEEIWGILNTNSLKTLRIATFVGVAHFSSHKKPGSICSIPLLPRKCLYSFYFYFSEKELE